MILSSNTFKFPCRSKHSISAQVLLGVWNLVWKLQELFIRSGYCARNDVVPKDSPVTAKRGALRIASFQTTSLSLQLLLYD